KLRSTDLFNYATIAKLVERMLELLTDEGRQQLLAEAARVLAPAVPVSTTVTSETGVPPIAGDLPQPISFGRTDAEGDSVPIAIIGYSGQFPDASNVAEFWANLRTGKDSIREVPASRWALNEFYSEDRKAPVKSYSKWGGWLPDPAAFDPLFFNISPREA